MVTLITLITFSACLFYFVKDLLNPVDPETKARDARIAARLAADLEKNKLKREKEEIAQHEHEFRLERARKAKSWWG
jgi:hypothetical protein